MNIPIFIINLKKDAKRKQYMQNLLAKFSLKAKFIEAVDGKLLSTKTIKNIYSEKQSIKNINRGMTKGEIGCVLSHKNIYEQMILDNLPVILVLEDDADFDDKLLDFIQQIDNLPKNWQLIHLGVHFYQEQMRHNIWYGKRLKSHTLRRFTEIRYGTHGYLINNSGAKKMLKHLHQISQPIDHYTGDDKFINLYALQNSIVSHNQIFQSNLGGERADDISKNITKSFKHKLANFLALNDFLANLRTLRQRLKPLRKYHI
ncbi:MAG: glycosyltransferase family 25 protein [Candidatus Thioglobus sp.]|nr:glycosyltransferase family 25 protein [Candidatus Thioglobus sp.]